MRSTNTSKVAKSICTLWKLSGLPSYKFENNRFVNKNSKAFLLPLLLVGVNMAVYLKFRRYEADLNSYVNAIQFATVYMLDVGLIASAYLKRKKLASIFSNFLVVEKMLQKFCLIRFPSGNVGRNLLIYLTIQSVLTVFQVIAINDVAVDIFSNFFIENICYNSLVLYSYNFNVILFFCLWLLKEFHSCFVNGIKENLTKKVKVVENDFRQIVQVHTLLHKLAKDVFKTFEKVILLKILKDFIVAVSTAYNATFLTMQLTTVLEFLLKMLQTVVFLVAILMSNFGMAYLFEVISRQDLVMMELLDEILITSKNEFLLAYKSIELFDLRLKRRNSIFYVCGLFPLNCTFIYTMIAGMASYMIYLVQFNQAKPKPL